MLFDADPDYIATLDSVTLVKLMKRLMLSESRLAGAPLRGAHAPLQITVADGGEDGRVEWTDGQPSTDYFPARFTIFQSKAQNLTDIRVKDEVLKRTSKGMPARLSTAISEVISRRGGYVIFCRERMTGEKRKARVKAIKAAILSGGGNPRAATIDVYDANVISDWVNGHPSVALWLASLRSGRNLAGFQTHESWGRSPDIAPPWQPSDEPRFTPINRPVPSEIRSDPDRNSWTFAQASDEVRAFLERDDGGIVRIFGPSGFGKSRFVYEVFAGSHDLDKLVGAASLIYCDASISGDEVAKVAIEAADAQMPMTLVVDECADNIHAKLANIAKRVGSRARLITIDIETKIRQAANTLTIGVEKSDDKLIKEIAHGVAPSLSESAQTFIAEFAEGFPRMAVLAAQQEGDGRQSLASVEQVLDRILWGNKPKVPEAQRALETAALVDWLGIEGRVEEQARFLAAEFASIPINLFVEHLLSFLPRGIITRRGDFLQVGPVPLAARLGMARLSVMTSDQLLQFFEKAPDEIRSSFLSRLRWLDTSPTAVVFAERLLQVDMLGNFDVLNSESGSKALDRLVHVAPGLVSQTIDRVFGSLSTDELKAASGARRNLVWTLEKLVFGNATFDRSARLLKKLATAEIENYANSATGIFQQLFQLYLSGTEVAPSRRVAILDEGLASTNQDERKLCVDALGQMLDTSHFSRGGGAERIGSGEAREDWQPKTYGDIWDFHRAAISRLVSLAVSDDPHAVLAKRHLGSHLRSLLSGLPLADVRAMITEVTEKTGFWPDAQEGISGWLYFDRSKGTPENIASEIRTMYDDFLPTDTVDLAVLYTRGWPTDLHDPDTRYERETKAAAKHDYEYSGRKASSVARSIAKDKKLCARAVERLACSEGHNTFPFAKALMGAVPEPQSLVKQALQFAEGCADTINRGFFGGLMAGAEERDPKLAKSLLQQTLKSQKLRPEAITLLRSRALRADDIDIVISLLKGGDIEPWQCQNLGLFHAEEAIFIPLVRELEAYGSDGLWTALDIIDMYLFGGHKPSRELITLAKRLLLRPEIVASGQRHTMDSHRLESVVARLVTLGAVGKGYASKLAKQLIGICRQDTNSSVFFALDDPVRKILGQLMSLHPDQIWNEIAKVLTSRSRYARHRAEMLLEARGFRDDHLARGLAFHIPAEQFLTWVRIQPSDRAAIAVKWLPIAERNQDGSLFWHPELVAYVDEFGDQPNVLSALAGRLHPNGWSGGLAPYLEPNVALVESWLNHRSSRVRAWVADYLIWLRTTIRNEKKRSEEDVVRYG
ncbi:hypothetical protein [Bosea sp. (in: a-proteobacteria)]|jgi:hypothetical protein|uniref:hypothetical protein n=1 Tax=Bosea sp. (in: a-proteobacteria) TaxID=1871050 RepID=UPI002DDDBB62|nr:hypothetical protein [Bosea sp. (in: a-proteobacteria)]HEV2513148.1 hypothetical protein [Bosea sp. (in: a-proteobacteria)]